MLTSDLIAWLLDSDPPLRWQVERDLVHEPSEVWETTRARIATEGFGERLLGLQDPDGQWAGSKPPKIRARDQREISYPWLTHSFNARLTTFATGPSRRQMVP